MGAITIANEVEMASGPLHDIFRRLASLPTLTALVAPVVLGALPACGPRDAEVGEPDSRIDFEVVATVNSPELTEISGIETLASSAVVVHNDDGKPDLFVVDLQGKGVARFRLANAVNHDWEDITWVPRDEGWSLAVGDIGDNQGRRKSIRIYFADFPRHLATIEAPEAIQEVPLRHTLELTYPDGPRDCEAMAYDASSGKILFLTKRDKPARLYGVDAATALAESGLALEFLGTAPHFRPPTRADFLHLGKESAWISQPTGMDISEDGRLAAVITYRSLYFFERGPEQTWAEAFQGQPREFLGPNHWGEEAVTFTVSADGVYITTEGRPAPVWRAGLPGPSN